MRDIDKIVLALAGDQEGMNWVTRRADEIRMERTGLNAVDRFNEEREAEKVRHRAEAVPDVTWDAHPDQREARAAMYQRAHRGTP